MSQEIRAHYDQIDLLPQCLEDWVPRDHPARFIREFVDALDLAGLGFQQRESEEGRPNYAADLLLKAWLYGYLARIRSTRGLERACREHLSLLWLTGRHAPDHNTLWRFWKESRAALRQVFRAGVKVAAEQGLIGMVCHAVDGTKIRAASSRRRVEHRKELERALERVELSIQEMEQVVEEAETQEEGEYRLPEALQEAEKLRQAIRASLGQMATEKREPRHPQEPEARLMPCEGRTEPAYNAQVVVDEQSELLVAAEVVNEESDNRRLVPMLEEVKENLGEVAAETVADGGYKSSVSLGEAERKGYSVLVNWGGDASGKQPGPYHKSRFHYQAQEDVVTCPRGERLEFEAIKTNRGKRYAVRGYRCRNFRQGPVRDECSRNRQGRLIEISPYEAAVERQRAKLQDAEKQKLLKRRKVIVEPAFGVIKQVEGFRRWTVRGLQPVKTQWALVCTAFNLKKMYKRWVAGELVLA
ncbi:MAG TPA: IS1182 family transposase [Anaerolineales bacterium]|nr:IS1182 family transposase [Anaerolineales bacterium]